MSWGPAPVPLNLNPGIVWTGTETPEFSFTTYEIGQYFNGVWNGVGLLAAYDGNVTQAGLLTLSLGNIKQLSGTYSLTAAALTSFSAPTLTAISNESNFTLTVNALTAFSMPNLSIVGGGFAFISSSYSTAFLLPDLYYCGSGNFTVTAALARSVSLPLLVYGGGNFTLTVNAATTISLPALSVTGGALSITANAATITLPSLASVSGGAVSIVDPSLVTFSIGAALKLVYGNFTITGAALSQASVDGILVSLAALNGSGGTTTYSGKTINLSGGTSHAPSSVGLAAKATLVARSCIVTTN